MATTENTGIEIAAQTEIHTVNNQFTGALIQLRNGIERLDDESIFPIAVVLKYLETVKPGLGCHPLEQDFRFILFIIRQSQCTGNDSGNMGAVTIGIQRAKTVIAGSQFPRRAFTAATSAIPLCDHIVVCLEMRVTGSDSGIKHSPGDIPTTGTIAQVGRAHLDRVCRLMQQDTLDRIA